jgi:hypothetical protein
MRHRPRCSSTFFGARPASLFLVSIQQRDPLIALHRADCELVRSIFGVL